MDIISAFSVQASALKSGQSNGQFSQNIRNSVFESLLGSFGTDTKSPGSSFFLLEFSSSLIDLVAGFQGAEFGAPVDFPFSPAFRSTFGASGPLPVFIALTSANLKLSAAQQLALQDIAVNNKDITKTPENVQKVAKELQAAGIGHA